jgi:hypothetical protein
MIKEVNNKIVFETQYIVHKTRKHVLTPKFHKLVSLTKLAKNTKNMQELENNRGYQNNSSKWRITG